MTNTKLIQNHAKSENDRNSNSCESPADDEQENRCQISYEPRPLRLVISEDLQSREKVVSLSFQAFLLHLSRNRFADSPETLSQIAALEANGNRTEVSQLSELESYVTCRHYMWESLMNTCHFLVFYASSPCLFAKLWFALVHIQFFVVKWRYPDFAKIYGRKFRCNGSAISRFKTMNLVAI
jgi:hypothetical protein